MPPRPISEFLEDEVNESLWPELKNDIESLFSIKAINIKEARLFVKLLKLKDNPDAVALSNSFRENLGNDSRSLATLVNKLGGNSSLSGIVAKYYGSVENLFQTFPILLIFKDLASLVVGRVLTPDEVMDLTILLQIDFSSGAKPDYLFLKSVGINPANILSFVRKLDTSASSTDYIKGFIEKHFGSLENFFQAFPIISIANDLTSIFPLSLSKEALGFAQLVQIRPLVDVNNLEYFLHTSTGVNTESLLKVIGEIPLNSNLRKFVDKNFGNLEAFYSFVAFVLAMNALRGTYYLSTKSSGERSRTEEVYKHIPVIMPVPLGDLANYSLPLAFLPYVVEAFNIFCMNLIDLVDVLESDSERIVPLVYSWEMLRGMTIRQYNPDLEGLAGFQGKLPETISICLEYSRYFGAENFNSIKRTIITSQERTEYDDANAAVIEVFNKLLQTLIYLQNNVSLLKRSGRKEDPSQGDINYSKTDEARSFGADRNPKRAIGDRMTFPDES